MKKIISVLLVLSMSISFALAQIVDAEYLNPKVGWNGKKYVRFGDTTNYKVHSQKNNQRLKQYSRVQLQNNE